MECKYKILWLDDFSMEEEIKTLELMYPDKLSFDQVFFVDNCMEVLEKDSEKYDAVILDANGLNSKEVAAEPKITGFYDLLELAKSKELLVYVFSGEISPKFEDDEFWSKALKEKVGNENIIYKSAGSTTLGEKIWKDLEEKNKLYVKHEKYLEFFKKGWLARNIKEPFDKIMKAYKEGKRVDFNYNEFRKVLEPMIDEAFSVLLPCQMRDFPEEDSGRYKKMIERIKNEFKYYGFECASLIYLYYLENAGSHLPNVSNKENIFSAAFSSFFIAADWFYEVMNNKPDTSETGMANTQVNDSNGRNNEKKYISGRLGEKLDVNNNGKDKYVDIRAFVTYNYKKAFVTGIRFNQKKERWEAYCDPSKSIY